MNDYWQLETRRVTAVQRSDSTWQVTLDVRARKMMCDTAGVETELPMNEWVDVGVFAAPEKAGGDAFGKPLYLRKQRIRSGVQTITLIVTRKPNLAGIDPFHLLDWDDVGENNNVARVSDTRNE